MRWSGPELAELGADATLSGRLRRWRNWFAPVSDVHVQQSCLIVGFRSRWRVYPPPGEREAWPGDSEKRFRVEDIANVTHTGQRANFDPGDDPLGPMLE